MSAAGRTGVTFTGLVLVVACLVAGAFALSLVLTAVGMGFGLPLIGWAVYDLAVTLHERTDRS